MKLRSGQRILITGASSGLGYAMAQQLATRHDVQVIATARRAERLETLQALAPDRISIFSLDVTDQAAVQDFSDHVGSLDGAILNAGVTQFGPFMDGDALQDMTIINTNVAANVKLTRALLPRLAQNGGHLLYVGSVGGLTPLPSQAVYSASKAFLHSFALALREELRAQGITVGVFAPGGMDTEMTDDPALDKLRGALAPVDIVAAQAIQAYMSGRALNVPGVSNKIMAAAIKFLPRALISRLVAKIYARK